jgi:hypothetical protein
LNNETCARVSIWDLSIFNYAMLLEPSMIFMCMVVPVLSSDDPKGHVMHCYHFASDLVVCKLFIFYLLERLLCKFNVHSFNVRLHSLRWHKGVLFCIWRIYFCNKLRWRFFFMRLTKCVCSMSTYLIGLFFSKYKGVLFWQVLFW